MTTEPTIELVDASVYRTADRGLAASLAALGFELVGVERDQDQIRFAFTSTRILLDAVDGYLADVLSVSACRMAEAFEHLGDLAAGWTPWEEIDLDL